MAGAGGKGAASGTGGVPGRVTTTDTCGGSHPTACKDIPQHNTFGQGLLEPQSVK